MRGHDMHIPKMLIALLAIGAYGQTQIRSYDLVTENTTYPANYDISWAQGESVRLNITAKRGNYYTAISSTSVPVIKAWAGADTGTLYANATGSITVADSGKVQIDLTSTQAAITPTGVYNYAVAVYDGTNYMGVVAAGRATIRGFPFGEVAYVGTMPTWAGVTQAVFLGGASGGITGRTITINSSGGGSSGSITQGQHNAILGGLTVSNAIVFATNATASSTAGATYWDTSNNALSTVMSVPGVLLQNGQELYIYAQNKAGRTISNGAPVKIIADPGGTTPRVDFASATNTTGMGHVVAVATHDVTNNASGYFTSFGIVHDLNTASWSNGDDLYLDGDGALTNTPAAPPARPTHVGYVIRSHASQGSIFVQTGAPENDPVWSASSNRIVTGLAAVGLVASNALPLTGGNVNGTIAITNAAYSFQSTAYQGYPGEFDADFTGRFFGDAAGVTNLPVYIASGGTVAQTSTGVVLTITGGGGAASLSPWTNTVNAAGNSLTNTLSVQWAAVTNYQWIRWVGTNPVEAILVNASGGVTGRVMRYSGADYIVAP